MSTSSPSLGLGWSWGRSCSRGWCCCSRLLSSVIRTTLLVVVVPISQVPSIGVPFYWYHSRRKNVVYRHSLYGRRWGDGCWPTVCCNYDVYIESLEYNVFYLVKVLPVWNYCQHEAGVVLVPGGHGEKAVLDALAVMELYFVGGAGGEGRLRRFLLKSSIEANNIIILRFLHE